MLPAADAQALAQLRGHVVLVGHGRVGATLAGSLRRHEIPFVVIEQDWHVVDLLRRGQILALAGEGGSPELLDLAGIAHARLLLVTTADPLAARRAVEHAHRVNPTIEVVARVHFAEQRDALRQFPRTRCVNGEDELARSMAQAGLGVFGLDAREVGTVPPPSPA